MCVDLTMDGFYGDVTMLQNSIIRIEIIVSLMLLCTLKPIDLVN